MCESFLNELMKKYLFIDRDGTLVYEPNDYQVDALNKIKFLKGVVPALLKLQQAGFSLIMVSNQDGLGTDSFPLETFTPSHEFILDTLESQGVDFENVLICPHKPEDNCECRKPKLGLVSSYMQDQSWDRANSYFIGDRDTDLKMAQNMGITGIRVGEVDTKLSDAFAPCGVVDADSPFADVKPLTWAQIVERLTAKPHRTAHVSRVTKETAIDVKVDLDTPTGNEIDTGIGFFDHMLDQIASHGGFQMKVKVKGDLNVDQHHTVEDTALALGQAIKQALGDKRGIGRFGFVVPMDEVMAEVSAGPSKAYVCECQPKLATLDANNQACHVSADNAADATVGVALDISGRPHWELDFNANFTREQINGFETQMVSHFFESLAVTLGLTLRMSVTEGNAHHQVEALFKAFGRALRPAIKVVDNVLPSTKGTL